VQARGIPSNNATATVAFASPGRVEGASETTQIGPPRTHPKGGLRKRGQFGKKRDLLGEIAAMNCKRVYKLR